VALAGQVGGLLHAALVPHLTCPDDGDLVHVAASAGARSAPLTGWATVGVATLTAGEAHERCLLGGPPASVVRLRRVHHHHRRRIRRRRTACT